MSFAKFLISKLCENKLSRDIYLRLLKYPQGRHNDFEVKFFVVLTSNYITQEYILFILIFS